MDYRKTNIYLKPWVESHDGYFDKFFDQGRFDRKNWSWQRVVDVLENEMIPDLSDKALRRYEEIKLQSKNDPEWLLGSLIRAGI